MHWQHRSIVIQVISGNTKYSRKGAQNGEHRLTSSMDIIFIRKGRFLFFKTAINDTYHHVTELVVP